LLITSQTKVLTIWFFNLSLDEYLDNTKAQSLNFESKTHETQLEDRKPRKATEGHLEEEKTAKPINDTKGDRPKKKPRKAQTQDLNSKLPLK
jgi:hypothetical protein